MKNKKYHKFMPAMYNHTDIDMTVHKAFENVVEDIPEHIGLVFGDKALSYREINNKANQLARFLVESGVKKEILSLLYFNDHQKCLSQYWLSLKPEQLICLLNRGVLCIE